MSLSDQDSGVMEGLSKTLFPNNGLESSIHVFLNGQTEDVIELVLVFIEKAISEHSSHEGSTFEKSSGILLLEGQKISGSLSDSGEDQLDSPHLSLVSQAVFTNDLQPRIMEKKHFFRNVKQSNA